MSQPERVNLLSEEPRRREDDLDSNYTKFSKYDDNAPDAFYHFNTKWAVLLLSGIVVLLSFALLIVSINFGTSCPSKVSPDIVINWIEENTTYSISTLECYNPKQWFNPTHDFDPKNPRDSFLGAFMLPPGMSMILGTIYAVVNIFFFAFFGIHGAIKRRNDMKKSLNLVCLVNLILMALVLLFNIIAWGFTIRIDHDTNPSVCQQLADIYFPFCDYVLGEFLMSVGFVALFAAAFKKTRDSYDD